MQLFRVVCRSLQCFVQVASASMDAQAVLDEAHVEDEEDVNVVSAFRSISTWAAKATRFVWHHH